MAAVDKHGENQQPLIRVHQDEHSNNNINKERIWIETKKLWHIVGPSIFCRIAIYSMNIVTQSFAGHLGDVQLASISVANTFIAGLAFGFLLGMASALETLCGQAYGAKKYGMLGIYMQRSWIILTGCCILVLPLYIFATPIMKAVGQPDDVAEQTGIVALWFIPLHFSFAFQFPIQRFLQSQLKTHILVWVSLAVFVFHLIASYLSVFMFDFGVVGLAVVLGVSWWLVFLGLFGYAALGGCPETWTGFSLEAFSGLGEFLNISLASGVMLCLENWYYRILMLMPGYLQNATIAVDALSICGTNWRLMPLLLQFVKNIFVFIFSNMSINGWEMMIPLAFFAATGVRVANELGAGNGNAARFATIISVVQSTIVGIIFCALILIFHDRFALIFTSSAEVLQAVDQISYLLAFTILLNSVQPVLSGVAVGSGWQSRVAYINLGCYYLVGFPLGVIMGWVFNLGVQGIWAGMIFGGTAVQTIILLILVIRCDWEKEARGATMNIEKWSRTSDDQS